MPRGDPGVGLLGAAPLLNTAIQQSQPNSGYNAVTGGNANMNNYFANQMQAGLNASQTNPMLNQQQQQPTYQGPDLSDLTYFNNRSIGGVSEDEMNSQRAQGMLANLKQLDPNAAFMPSYGGEGNLMGYTLNFDATKLPGVNGQGQLGQGQTGVGTGATFMPKFSTVQDKMTFANPNAMYNSAPYGQITDNRNIIQKPTWLDYVGPLAVGAFGGFLGGLSPLLSGAKGIQSMLRSGRFNPMQMMQMMPYLSRFLGG